MLGRDAPQAMQLAKTGRHSPGGKLAASWAGECLEQYERLQTPCDGRCFWHAIMMSKNGYEKWCKLTQQQQIDSAIMLVETVALSPEALVSWICCSNLIYHGCSDILFKINVFLEALRMCNETLYNWKILNLETHYVQSHQFLCFK